MRDGQWGSAVRLDCRFRRALDNNTGDRRPARCCFAASALTHSTLSNASRDGCSKRMQVATKDWYPRPPCPLQPSLWGRFRTRRHNWTLRIRGAV